MLFNKKQLEICIQSDMEIVAIWGAFQVLKLDDQQMVAYLPFFLKSSFVDIQDAGLAKIAELKQEGFTAEIIRLFRTSEGQLKYTAAYALSNFPNDITRVLLHKWFDLLSSNNQSTRLEFDAAVYSYLNLDKQRNFHHVLKALTISHNDMIKSSVLFTNLLQFCSSESDYREIIDQYFILRDQFSDAELTLHLVESLIHAELHEWWAGNLSKGYSISSIYQQCYLLLGLDEGLTDRYYWNEFESAIGDADRLHNHAPDNPKALIETVLQWVNHLLTDQEQDQKLLRLKWILEGFYRNENLFINTIPKIVELEIQFILAIPLFILLEKSFQSWIDNPSEHVEQIANYYHSTLLIREFREKILSLFFPERPQWAEEALKIINEDTPVDVNDNKNDIIWSFYRGELLGYPVPWPTIFPNPDYSKYLADGLADIYYANFGYFVERQDKVSVDYALQLFQLKPNAKAIQLIHKHFDYLCQFHTEILYQTIEYLPDPSFLELLVKNYEDGEQDISRLILLISKVFEIELPEAIRAKVTSNEFSKYQISGVKKPVRLHCSSCNSSFQYPVDIIYIDEASILRFNHLSEESIWVPHGFTCKKCQSDIPFELDTNQLDELSQQSRVDRILKITPQTGSRHFGYQTSLIDFPRHNGRIYSPGEFFEFMEEIETNTVLSKEELKDLWMKQARLKKSMFQWQECKAALEKIKSLEKIDEEWMFLMGLVSFKLSNYADARKYFDWIVKKYPEEFPQSSFTPYVEKSRLYISQLNSKATKKALFKVITGKK